jgi:hypothetical protein
MIELLNEAQQPFRYLQPGAYAAKRKRRVTSPVNQLLRSRMGQFPESI